MKSIFDNQERIVFYCISFAANKRIGVCWCRLE